MNRYKARLYAIKFSSIQIPCDGGKPNSFLNKLL